MDWQHVAYFLAGIVIAGILAAMAQIINIKMLTGGTKLRINVKKAGDDGTDN